MNKLMSNKKNIMKNIFLLFFLTLGVITCSNLYSQTEDSVETTNDTLITAVDTTAIKDSLKTAFLNSPERLKVISLINQVNDNSSKVDLIHSESVVKFKASSLDQTGEIEIKVKKNDDIWFRIWGSFAFVSKDAFIAHFNRKKFIYFDNLNDKVIEGPTTDNNIGYIARIKCSFDDLLNVMSGTGRVVYGNADTLAIENDIIIVVKGKDKVVKYTLDANKKYVEKYSYYNSKKKEYLRINFGNFVNVNGGYFAKKVDITKPLTSEYLKIVNESYTTSNQNMNFNVDFPSDVRRVKWDK
jgi:hypothetical protein